MNFAIRLLAAALLLLLLIGVGCHRRAIAAPAAGTPPVRARSAALDLPMVGAFTLRAPSTNGVRQDGNGERIR